MTSVDLSGGCLCGGIRYRIAGAPAFVGQCYRKGCQKASGTGHATVIGVLDSQLSIAGKPAVCASRLYTAADSAEPVRMVHADTLDDPNAVTPTVAIYVKNALSWDRIGTAGAKFDRLPPGAPIMWPSCVRIRAFELVMAGC